MPSRSASDRPRSRTGRSPATGRGTCWLARPTPIWRRSSSGPRALRCSSDPRSPWQRGTSENTNGLLRQYLPRGTDLSRHSQDELDLIALKLNTRPRKALGYATPAAKLEEVLR